MEERSAKSTLKEDTELFRSLYILGEKRMDYIHYQTVKSISNKSLIISPGPESSITRMQIVVDEYEAKIMGEWWFYENSRANYPA